MNRKNLREFIEKREIQKIELEYERKINFIKKCIYVGIAVLLPMIFGIFGFYLAILGVILSAILVLIFTEE